MLDNVARILEAQTTPYRQVREFGEDLPMASRIIKVANAYDDLPARPEACPRAAAMERIHLGLGYEYDPGSSTPCTRVLSAATRDGATGPDGGMPARAAAGLPSRVGTQRRAGPGRSCTAWCSGLLPVAAVLVGASAPAVLLDPRVAGVGEVVARIGLVARRWTTLSALQDRA